MPGRSNRLTAQIGEFLACAELGKLGYIATPFAGNVPEFDVLVADANCRATPIQVKASNSFSWPSWAENWMNIEIDPITKRQNYINKKDISNPNLIYVFVSISRSSDTKDRFFILRKHQLQDIAIHGYKSWMDLRDWIRPKNPESFDCRLTLASLISFENKWSIISEEIQG